MPLRVTAVRERAGKPTGEAWARFPSDGACSEALAAKNKQPLGKRYIECATAPLVRAPCLSFTYKRLCCCRLRAPERAAPELIDVRSVAHSGVVPF